MKPFSKYLRANFRKSFWEIAIIEGVLFAAVTILAVVMMFKTTGGSLSGYLIVFGLSVVAIPIIGLVSAVLLTPLHVLNRWLRDRNEEKLDGQIQIRTAPLEAARWSHQIAHIPESAR